MACNDSYDRTEGLGKKYRRKEGTNVYRFLPMDELSLLGCYYRQTPRESRVGSRAIIHQTVYFGYKGVVFGSDQFVLPYSKYDILVWI